jgi:hypothetical protein
VTLRRGPPSASHLRAADPASAPVCRLRIASFVAGRQSVLIQPGRGEASGMYGKTVGRKWFPLSTEDVHLT